MYSNFDIPNIQSSCIRQWSNFGICRKLLIVMSLKTKIIFSKLSVLTNGGNYPLIGKNSIYRTAHIPNTLYTRKWSKSKEKIQFENFHHEFCGLKRSLPLILLKILFYFLVKKKFVQSVNEIRGKFGINFEIKTRKGSFWRGKKWRSWNCGLKIHVFVKTLKMIFRKVATICEYFLWEHWRF